MAHWVDYLIVAVVILAALHGWQTGAIRQVLAFGGLWIGLIAGVVLAPTIARHVAPTSAGLVAVAVVLVAVMVCGSIGQMAGWRIATVVRRVRLGVVDDALVVAERHDVQGLHSALARCQVGGVATSLPMLSSMADDAEWGAGGFCSVCSNISSIC